MIPAATLTAMQAAAVKTLDLTCTIQRNTGARTPGGGKAASWATVTGGANVKCRLTDLQGGLLQIVAERLGDLSSATLALPIATNVQEGDEITQIKRGGVELVTGMKFQVQHLLDMKSNAVLMRALVSVIR